MLPFTAVMPMDVGQQASVSVHAEERYRSGSDIKSVETEFNPILKYDYIWNEGQNHFVALYAPRFIYTSSWQRRSPNPNLINPDTLSTADPNKTPFAALQNGGVGYEMVRPRWRLSLYQFAAYGPLFTSSLLIQAPWEGGGLPPDPNPIIPAIVAARFTLIFAQTQLFVPIKLSPRTALIPGATYNAFGGADIASRGVIGLSQGPGVSLALEHQATREDRFISYIGAGQVSTEFQDAREAQVDIFRAEATQTWRHWYTGHLYHELQAGVSVGGDKINGYTLFTNGYAGFVYDSWEQLRLPPGAAPQGNDPGRGGHWQIGAVAKFAPWIDLFSGELEQRFVVSFGANYGIDRITFRSLVAQARVVNTPDSVAQYQIVYGEAAIRYQITPTLFADGGLRLAYQNFNNAVRFNELTQATIFGGITYAPLAARF